MDYQSSGNTGGLSGFLSYTTAAKGGKGRTNTSNKLSAPTAPLSPKAKIVAAIKSLANSPITADWFRAHATDKQLETVDEDIRRAQLFINQLADPCD